MAKWALSRSSERGDAADLHHTTGYPRHFRRGGDDALACDADRHGGSRTGRQCVRCGRGGGLCAADRRAASQWAWRGIASHRAARGRAMRRRSSADRGLFPAMRPSSGSPRWAWRRCPEPGCCRRSCRARSTAGCCCLCDYGTLKLRDVLSYAISYAEHGFPLVPRIVSTIIPAVDYFKTEWPSSGEVWLTNGKAPHPDKPFRTPAIADDLPAHPRRSGKRRRRPDPTDRGCAPRVLQGLRRRGDRPVLPDRIDGLDRRTPSRIAHRRRSCAICGARRGAGVGRLSRPHGPQARALVAGADVPADAAAARAHRRRRDGSARSGVRAHAGRGAEARLRGSRRRSTATPTRSMCRSRRCSRRNMRTRAAS